MAPWRWLAAASPSSGSIAKRWRVEPEPAGGLDPPPVVRLPSTMVGQGNTIRRRRLWDSGAAVKAYALTRRAAERVGLQLVLKTYYSPIPDLSTLPEGIWDEPDPLRGIELDLDVQIERLQGRLSELMAEFAPTDARSHAYEELN